MKKLENSSNHKKVVEFLDELDHPHKKEIEEVRRIILDANGQLTEHIKWNAPSFCFNGEDRITFNFHSKEGFRLVFHTGAKAKNTISEGRLFEDKTGLLEWVANDRAIAKFGNFEDVRAKEQALVETVKNWIKATDNS